MQFNLILASMTILLLFLLFYYYFFFSLLVIFSNFFTIPVVKIIPVLKENAKLKLRLAIPTGVPIILAKEIIYIHSLVPDKKVLSKILSFVKVKIFNSSNVFS